MSDTLRRICDDKRAHVAASKQRRPLAGLETAAAASPPPRGFRAALDAKRSEGRIGLIAEVKKASPSRGVIRADFDPAGIAAAYARAGAACVSVLTDGPYFGGGDADFVAVRERIALPMIRKDFMVDPYQVIESRALGADAVLLIVAALSPQQAGEIERTAHALGMDVLIEVHDEAERDFALAQLSSRLIGVNNRNLKTLIVDPATTLRLAPAIPDDCTIVCESGISGPKDVATIRAAGIDCFLIGESLMRQPDIEAATRRLLEES